MIASYDDYAELYLLGRTPTIPGHEFAFFEREASEEIDRFTFGRVQRLPNVTEEIKLCACCLAEFMYKADKMSSSLESQGVAGPLVSWSNDGQSGSIDASSSIYTKSGKRDEIRRIIHKYLGGTGLLYSGGGYDVGFKSELL